MATAFSFTYRTKPTDPFPCSTSKPASFLNPSSLLPPVTHRRCWLFPASKRMNMAVCVINLEKRKQKRDSTTEKIHNNKEELNQNLVRKMSKTYTYPISAAIMHGLGITSMAVAAVYCRFSWKMQGGEIPLSDLLGTCAVSAGAAVWMEVWSKWVHRALWHSSLWHIHESHHRARDGAFELNDVFAIVNSLPAVALLFYGFFHDGLLPGICFGAGLGITVTGMFYMFVHDGLVHGRFPVGPVADIPFFQRVAAAHQIHHSQKFNGVPFGFFVGPKELEEAGGLAELEKEIDKRIKLSKES